MTFRDILVACFVSAVVSTTVSIINMRGYEGGYSACVADAKKMLRAPR